MLAFLIVFIGGSKGLNNVNCNAVAYEHENKLYAEPAGACHADTFHYYNYSYMYYCNGDEMRQKIWKYDRSCSGIPDHDQSWQTIAQNNGITTSTFDCTLDVCEYAQHRIYYPFNYSSTPYCDIWTPTPQDSGYIDEYYIRDYCFDYGTFSGQWVCTSVGSGGVGWYNHDGVTDCSGQGTLAVLRLKGEGQCFNYTTVQDTIYRQREDWLQCDVATPSPTPQWTQPVTKLPCNAVEFVFAGGKVSYPVGVCIHDKNTQQSVMFQCDNANTLRFTSWDNTHQCEGTPLNEGSSFSAYVDSQPTVIKQQFGAYKVECGLEECDYVILRDYTFTGDCESFIPDTNTEYSESIFIKDYCLEIPGEGSIAWGCDEVNQHITEISYFNGVIDCSDKYQATLDWYDYGKGKCVTGTILNVQQTNYIDTYCFTAPTPEPSVSPTDMTDIPSTSPISPTRSPITPTEDGTGGDGALLYVQGCLWTMVVLLRL